ncbi:hypothetical protein [Bacillus sp. FJAT-27245]|uniref:hypothetical protein n=1 Tax=Bacillus sp. FJAT-27245 TaxID=1684144 RepID=UPI0006A76344|nr:hypothetical protein [Bacillus sp. FJAT-27245]
MTFSKFFKSLCIIITIFFSLPSWTYAAKFSSQGLDDVVNASKNNTTNAGLPSTDYNYLAAITLAPTWLESVDSNQGTGYLDKTPLPMALGRSDFSVSRGYQLWVDGQTGYNAIRDGVNYYRRVHWNAHRGLWALDGIGMGKYISLKGAIDTSVAAPFVAEKIARKYKSSSATTTAEKRKYAWSDWYACDRSTNPRDAARCQDVFNTIYNSSTKALNITRDTTVTRLGGLTSHTCDMRNIPDSSFPCYKYDISKVQGDSNSKNVFWLNLNHNGSSTSEPLPLPFYSYSGGYYDNYIWFVSDTGYSSLKAAQWDMATDPRSGVVWSSSTTVRVIQ